MRGPCDGQHIVQRHGDVGDHDLDQGGRERLARDAQGLGRRASAVVGGQGGFQLGLGLGLVVCPLLLQFAPHLPADPQQQDAAREQQADDGQQLHRDQGEADAQDDGGGQADQDGLLPLLGGEGGRREADGHGIVAGQHQIDHQNLAEGCGLAGEFGRREEFHDARLGQGVGQDQAMIGKAVTTAASGWPHKGPQRRHSRR